MNEPRPGKELNVDLKKTESLSREVLEARLGAMRQRLLGITKPPWVIVETVNVNYDAVWSVRAHLPPSAGPAIRVCDLLAHDNRPPEQTRTDAAFIANAPEDLSLLLLALDQAEALIHDRALDVGLLPLDALPSVRARQEIDRLRQAMQDALDLIRRDHPRHAVSILTAALAGPSEPPPEPKDEWPDN
jgi:hypothetical protein